MQFSSTCHLISEFLLLLSRRIRLLDVEFFIFIVVTVQNRVLDLLKSVFSTATFSCLQEKYMRKNGPGNELLPLSFVFRYKFRLHSQSGSEVDNEQARPFCEVEVNDGISWSNLFHDDDR